MSDYAPQSWTDDPGSATPLSAARLNHMETGIDTGHSELAAHEANTSNPHAVTATQIGAVKAQVGAANAWVQATAPAAQATGDLWFKV